jgi:radical SAM superfamily enzyme YgiQ (UPF0313 family)
MRVVLADLKGRDRFVSKDTVVGGFGHRLRPFSRVTSIAMRLKRMVHNLPSVHLAYAAAIFRGAGHEVVWSDGEQSDGDLAIVLSSIVDHRREASWAAAMRARGVRVGVIGITASKLPQLFEPHVDFLVSGEPEAALLRLARGEMLSGRVESPAVPDLDALPFPQWHPQMVRQRRLRIPFFGRPADGVFPLLASRSCPEFCTYCPHRILASYRVRSVGNILEELEQLEDRFGRPHVVFRDPLFTQERDRIMELCDGILSRRLALTFECETRLDRLDAELLATMQRAGLRCMTFGVETISPDTLKRNGRRPIPPEHQRAILLRARELGIATSAFFVFGFLEDTWESISATIQFSTELGSTLAQFKLLTPFPGTPLFKRLEPLITETDWERFDGVTPTFRHPSLLQEDLTYLLGAAYARFYLRPSFLANYLRIAQPGIREWVTRLDARVERRHARREVVQVSRSASC